MDISKLLPNTISDNTGKVIQELMRAFLVRTNFVPALRQYIGWRGLKDMSRDCDVWTAKIRDFDGVFGLCFEKAALVGDIMWGRHILSYFPHPEEELVDALSVQAIAYTQRGDYMELIRRVPNFPDFAALFNIGAVDLYMNKARNALWLGLETMTRQRTIALDGVRIMNGDRIIQIVEDGGCDQDFPSYETAIAFFEVLAASYTFCLEEPPGWVRHSNAPGMETSYDSEGNWSDTPSELAETVRVLLGFGSADIDPTENIFFSQRAIVVTADDAEASIYKDTLWWTAHEIANRTAVDKTMLGIDERPQLLILTGFLGSGKTTFLRSFIEYQLSMNRFVAVIQNEIGETGLDGKLLEDGYALVEVDEGCICCTLAGNLKNAVRRILADFSPDYVILETTGLANPLNLLDEIEELEDLLRFDSITTMVDCINISAALDGYEVARRQIKAADILLLNKKDLLGQEAVGEVIVKIRELNPNALLLTTTYGDVNHALLYGLDRQELAGRPPQASEKASHVTHEDDHLTGVKVLLPNPVDRDKFIEELRGIPPEVLRIKGIVKFKADKVPKLVQFVAGRFEISEYNKQWRSDCFLICIGRSLTTSPLQVRQLE